MRSVVQRVESCLLSVEGREISRIGPGLVCYLGVAAGDTDSDLAWMVKKVAGLRIFHDEAGKMNFSVLDLGLAVLVVPQFTLFGDVRRGYRPSFSGAEAPKEAQTLYEHFLDSLRTAGVKSVAGGVFGADMTIDQKNRGPVTIILDSRSENTRQ
ncbi:MAG: D-tyrosyl-tRNA(Tyr) deacylase [Candidatus Riflebacteria bacterium]|nr:D-tyrosyl-tRNA(Tyr) deacylase [Candidatus Riflebacteria bacterium]